MSGTPSTDKYIQAYLQAGKPDLVCHNGRKAKGDKALGRTWAEIKDDIRMAAKGKPEKKAKTAAQEQPGESVQAAKSPGPEVDLSIGGFSFDIGTIARKAIEAHTALQRVLMETANLSNRAAKFQSRLEEDVMDIKADITAIVDELIDLREKVEHPANRQVWCKTHRTWEPGQPAHQHAEPDYMDEDFGPGLAVPVNYGAAKQDSESPKNDKLSWLPWKK